MEDLKLCNKYGKLQRMEELEAHSSNCEFFKCLNCRRNVLQSEKRAHILVYPGKRCRTCKRIIPKSDWQAHLLVCGVKVGDARKQYQRQISKLTVKSVPFSKLPPSARIAEEKFDRQKSKLTSWSVPASFAGHAKENFRSQTSKLTS
jgi:hypothetical protein